jgi:carboxypeptidase Taq
MAALDELRALLAEISDLGRARALLSWDEWTQMPPRGATVRAEQLSTLSRLRHQRLASDELGRLLDLARADVEGQPYDSFEASVVRMTTRHWEKARRVPADLRAEITRQTSISEHAWEAAKNESDFQAFLPHLERVTTLARRYLECFEFDHPYDPLLDDYEPGMKTAELHPVLAELRDGLRPLLAEIASSEAEVDDSCLYGEFPLDAQRQLAQEVLEGMPLQEGSWRLDETVHPFATGMGVSDLRITTRFVPSYIGAALWAVIHEGGHAAYQNGIDPELERTPLCQSASLGFDESQSRLWENWVGRGRQYLTHLHPRLAELFPGQFGGVDAETLYRAASKIQPSLIRIEADEITYNLHIALRFELELQIVEGRLELADLPEAWNALVADYMGLKVPDDAHGVLQDIHWASASFGYFPTYALGNVIAGQLWEAARADLVDLDDQLAAGEMRPLRDWLAERVYRHGGKFLPAEMVDRVCGGSLDPAPLLRYLRNRFGEVYGLEPARTATPSVS